MVRLLLFLAPLFLVAPALAGTFTSEELNFAVEWPESWKRLDPPPEPYKFAVASPDQKRLFAIGSEASSGDPASELRSLLSGLRKGVTKGGAEVVAEGPEQMAGTTFVAIVSKVSNGAGLATWAAVGPERAYMISAMSATGDPRADSEVSQVRQSLRFLRPFQSVGLAGADPRQGDPLFRASYQAGRMVGGVLLALIPVAIIIVAIRRYRSSPQAGP